MPTACPDGLYSREGASDITDCKNCTAGYYCVLGVHTAYLIDCPVGHYCEEGLTEPEPCPVGTYNSRTNRKEEEDCLTCPRGTSCDVEGIYNYMHHMCPPGHYCPEGRIDPIPCPQGSYRPNPGAAKPGP